MIYQPKTIFPVLSMDRSVVRWEEHLDVLTPWENHSGVWFKMEQEFAPLGAGGPNGSKMRQLIHLFQAYRRGATSVLTAASVLSPQHLMTAILAAHYGLPSVHIIGSSTPKTMKKHASVQISLGFGAQFQIINVGYNPALQAEVRRLTDDSTFVVPYGITRDHRTHPVEEIRAFHEVGARQTENLPEDLKLLVVPAGSCNSLTSILLGLSHDPKNLQVVYAVGIGPDRREWTRDRPRLMGVDPDRLPFRWVERSLHAEGVKYGDSVRESFDGIDLHKTYEGKVFRHLRQERLLSTNGKAGFWIVGGQPSVDMVKPFYTHPEAAA
jgi:hypothetical protein